MLLEMTGSKMAVHNERPDRNIIRVQALVRHESRALWVSKIGIGCTDSYIYLMGLQAAVNALILSEPIDTIYKLYHLLPEHRGFCCLAGRITDLLLELRELISSANVTEKDFLKLLNKNQWVINETEALLESIEANLHKMRNEYEGKKGEATRLAQTLMFKD